MEQKPEKAKEQYDTIADTFVTGKERFFVNQEDFGRSYILDHLKGVSGAVLDAGCGAGEDTAEYEKLPNVHVYGVDPSASMIEKAKTNLKNPENLSVAGYERLPFADQTLDAIVARFSLHYMADIDAAYKEMVRVLKSGGKLIQVVDHPLADAVEGEKFVKNGVPHVRIKLYNQSVTVEFPQHNVSDYLSRYFLQNFELTDFTEHTGTDREFQAGPNALGYAAIKK